MPSSRPLKQAVLLGLHLEDFCLSVCLSVSVCYNCVSVVRELRDYPVLLLRQAMSLE